MTQTWEQIQHEGGNDPHSLAMLVQNLRDYLGPKSGINSEDIEVDTLKELIGRYDPQPQEWLKYGRPDPSRNYTRLLVDGINGKCNLLFIVWNPTKKSPIHDHANAHCVMKIILGDLKETVYHWPEKQCECCKTGHGPMKLKKETIYKAQEVAYIADSIGLHSMANPHSEDVAVSLHLYTPPYAADFGFNIFDEKTGRSSHVR